MAILNEGSWLDDWRQSDLPFSRDLILRQVGSLMIFATDDEPMVSVVYSGPHFRCSWLVGNPFYDFLCNVSVSSARWRVLW